MRKIHDPGFQLKRSPLIAAALEEHRPNIIRDLVYQGSLIDEVTERYGVAKENVLEALPYWRVDAHPFKLMFRQRNWLRDKASYGNDVPIPLKRMNRSEFIAMWDLWDIDSLCAVFDVDHDTLIRALGYHCVPWKGLQDPAHKVGRFE